MKPIIENANTPQTFPCTDLGNMERFIDQHKDYIRSTSSGAVFEWTGNRWKPVSYADIFNLARKTVLKIQSEARHAAAEAEANDLRRWSLTSQSEAKIRSMINMACKHEADRTEKGITTLWVAGLIYSALTVALFIQALFGQPLINI